MLPAQAIADLGLIGLQSSTSYRAHFCPEAQTMMKVVHANEQAIHNVMSSNDIIPEQTKVFQVQLDALENFEEALHIWMSDNCKVA